MKKILLLIFICTAIKISAQEQFNIGVNGGITVGATIKSASNIAFGFDANYLFKLTEDFVIGPSLGFIYFNAKSIEGVKRDPFMYVPMGGAVRFNSIDDVFYIGIDAGFAVGISPEGDSGAVFLKPIIGYKINDSFKLNVFYSGLRKTTVTYGYVGFGFTFDILASRNDYYTY